MRTSSNPTLPGSARLALTLTIPVAIGAVTASLAGLLAPGTYASETANWAGQAAGQDAVNLVIYPAMLVLAWRASRGSAAAYLWWLGAAAYSTYSYLLYAGFVHFSGWFLPYVATFGASTFALVAGVAALDPGALRARFRPDAAVRLVGTALAALGAMFALLWVSEVVPATLSGTVPWSVTEAGLVTNPVWVLDLGLVLPAMIVGGLLLRRRRPLGYLLAPPLLAFGALMGTAILGMLVALGLRGEPLAVVPLVLMAATVIVETALLSRLLTSLEPGVTVTDLSGPIASVTGGQSTAAHRPTADKATRWDDFDTSAWRWWRCSC